MPDWKQLTYGFFSAIGVIAFLTVVANEIEYLNHELAMQAPRARPSESLAALPPATATAA